MKPTFGKGKAEKEVEFVAELLNVPVPKTEREERALLYQVAKAIKFPVPQNLEQRNLLLKEVLKRKPLTSEQRRAAARRISEPAREEVPRSEWKPTEIRDISVPMDPDLRRAAITDYMERFLSPYPFDLKTWKTEILQEVLAEIDELPEWRKEVYIGLKIPERIIRELKARGKKVDEKYWAGEFAKLPPRPPKSLLKKPEPEQLAPSEPIEGDEEAEAEKPEKPTGERYIDIEEYERVARERIPESPKVANRFAAFLERNDVGLSTEEVERALKDFQMEEVEQRVKEEDEDVDELVSDYNIDPSDAFARREAIDAGERVSPLISLDEFRDEWVKFHGKPESESDRRFLERGIQDFYSDYVTSSVRNVQDYFRQIRSEGDIKEELLKSERAEEIQDLLSVGYRPSELKGLSEDLLLKKYYNEFKNELNFLEKVAVKKN